MRFLNGVLMGVLCALSVLPVQAQDVVTQYMAVYVQGERVGYHKQVRKVFPDSVVTSEMLTFSVAVDDGTIEKLAIDETVETPDGELIHFRHETIRAGRLFRLAGHREGQELIVSLASQGGQKQERPIAWFPDVVMAEGRRLLIKEKGLKAGTQYTFAQFFGDALSTGDVSISVGPKVEVDVLGEKQLLTETHEEIKVQDRHLKYVVYRDETSKPIKIIAPEMHMEWVACSEDFAMTDPADEQDNE